MEVLLDSNFIISCIRRRIDFISQLEEQGFRVLVPKEVMQELKDLRLKVPHSEKINIDLAFKLFEDKRIKRAKLGSGKIDEKLIERGKQGDYIASLDAAIKRNVHNKVIINNAANRIEIERE